MGEVTGTASGSEPDYRVSLAIERTYLAYVRTSLALLAAGVAVVGAFPDAGYVVLRRTIGLVLVLAGLVLAPGARGRWRQAGWRRPGRQAVAPQPTRPADRRRHRPGRSAVHRAGPPALTAERSGQEASTLMTSRRTAPWQPLPAERFMVRASGRSSLRVAPAGITVADAVVRCIVKLL